MQSNDWREYKKSNKSLVDTGRERLHLEKYPKDLDFSKTIGGTTYTVKSHFNPNADETLLGIVLRWMDSDTDVSKQ